MSRKVLLFVMLVALGPVALLSALDPPPDIPEGTDWDTYWNKTMVDTCCGKQVATYALDTSACRDFNTDEKDQEKTDFLAAHSGHVTFRDDATYSYNCHGYVFHGGGVWGGDPANWEGPVYPCYYEDDSGPVFRFGGHSSFAGTDYTYLAKCGCSIKCDHDDSLYGAHTERWSQHPAP
jgi:hypothetical protein